MKLRDFIKKYSESNSDNFLPLNVSGKKYLFAVTISFFGDEEPEYNVFTKSGYIPIGELNEFRNQVEETYDLLKLNHKFLCELKLDEELTEEQETVLEAMIHALG